MSAFFKKKSVKICAVALIFIISVLLFLEIGTLVVSKTKTPLIPSYARLDISELLDGRELSDDEYDLIYMQSGLTRIGVDDLLAAGKPERILEIQDDFFASDTPAPENFGMFVTAFDRELGHYAYPDLQVGDIVCSTATYLSCFEIGHCAIVVDAENALLAEITGYDSELEIVPAAKVFTNATHIVLRPKCDESVRTAAAEYVKENLLGIKYDILVGIWNKKAPKSLERTHCAHFVWYVYNMLGLDIDSNGGAIVSPRDIYMSENLDIIAVRGVDPLMFKR